MFTLRFVALVAFSLVASSVSDDVPGLPDCASKCMDASFKALNNACSETDLACLCRNTNFLTNTANCFKTSCTVADLATAQSWSAKSCAAAGVTATANAINSGLLGANGTNSTKVPNAPNQPTANQPAPNANSAPVNNPPASKPNSSGNSIFSSTWAVYLATIGTALVSSFLVA